MKIVIFSDLHAHPFKPYATILENGMNSRLSDAISCISQVMQLARDNEADLVLFGGDMFHVRRSINVMAFNAVYEAMASFAMYKIPVAMIHGNHDQADRAGEEHSIHAFRTFCTVINHPGWEIVTGRSGKQYGIMGVPYTENIEHLRHVMQEPCPAAGVHRLFLGHLGIQGARVGADFVYVNPHDAQVGDLKSSEFDAGYLGHYHEHQKLDNGFHYIGASLQHTWGDRDQWRGCLIYDTDTGRHKKIALKAPKFQQMSVEDLSSGPILTTDNYVRIVDSRVWPDSEREDIRKSLEARSLEIVKPKNGVAKASSTRLEMGPSMSYLQMMQTFVRSGVQRADDLDPEYLIQLGAEVLEEVEQ